MPYQMEVLNHHCQRNCPWNVLCAAAVSCHVQYLLRAELCLDWECCQKMAPDVMKLDTARDTTDTQDTWHFIAAQIWRQEASTRLEAACVPSDERWIEIEADIVSAMDCINHVWYISMMVSDCELDMFDLYHFNQFFTVLQHTQTQSEPFPSNK